MSRRAMSPEKLNKVRRRLIFDSPATTDDAKLPPQNPNILENNCHCDKADINPKCNDQDPLPLEQLNDDIEELSHKYNFDFRNEVPLEGNWEWEVVPQRIPDHKEAIRNLKEVDDFRDDRKV